MRPTRLEGGSWAEVAGSRDVGIDREKGGSGKTVECGTLKIVRIGAAVLDGRTIWGEPCFSPRQQPGSEQQSGCETPMEISASEQQGRRSGIPNPRSRPAPTTTAKERFTTRVIVHLGDKDFGQTACIAWKNARPGPVFFMKPAMIIFVSLYLGLVTGLVPVSVAVEEPVARVELMLDGNSVGSLGGRPWSLDVDLGNELAPHELVARAFDGQGREIGQARQWLNLPRPRAEVELLLEHSQDGRATAAHVSSASVAGHVPKSARVTFDGVMLPLAPDHKVTLPPYDPGLPHVLSARLGFADGLVSRADVVLGGGSSSEARSELTAVPVTVRGVGRLPSVEEMQNWFVERGKPLAVAAIEHEAADVFLVRDVSAKQSLQRLGSVGDGRSRASDTNTQLDLVRLNPEDRISITWPVARHPGGGKAFEAFEHSEEIRSRDAGFHFLMTQVEYPGAAGREQRFADAVAVAGLQAFSGRSRRAVVLLLPGIPDNSHYAPETARNYLARLRVPLKVWSVDPSVSRSPWGDVEDVSTPARLEQAVRSLRKDLEEQKVIWISGKHLPQDIALSGEAKGIELVH